MAFKVFFTMFQGFLNPGVMQAGCSGVYIAWVGKQILEEEYEILVQVY